ncbi:MAG: hypothetical protein HFF38_05570, partial [Lawsonibacter sp.]|nr:hypothetical protein [Lawsonibacter sp.]
MPTETDELILKQLPHSVEAEHAVLGSILIDPRCVSEVIDKLRPEDFYLRQNRVSTADTICSGVSPPSQSTVMEPPSRLTFTSHTP